MENIKIYAAAYLGLGFLVSLQLWRLHKKETAPTDFVSAALESLRPPRPSDVLRERLLALTVILTGTFIWPFFLGDRLLRKCFSATQEPMRQRVGDQYLEMPLSLANLGDVLSIKEIEEREMIEDPLNAVPRLPFGFLNHAWIVFKRRHPRARDFRPFDVMQEGSSETLAGYALVKDGKVVDEFFSAGY